MLTKEELDQINRFSKAELTADQVYTFSVRLCDNEVDRGFERFGTEDLERLESCFWERAGSLTTSGQPRVRRPGFTGRRWYGSPAP